MGRELIVASDLAAEHVPGEIQVGGREATDRRHYSGRIAEALLPKAATGLAATVAARPSQRQAVEAAPC